MAILATFLKKKTCLCVGGSFFTEAYVGGVWNFRKDMSASAAREEENPGPSSGGFIANVGVKGSVFLGTQQQFLFRNWRLALTI